MSSGELLSHLFHHRHCGGREQLPMAWVGSRTTGQWQKAVTIAGLVLGMFWA